METETFAFIEGMSPWWWVAFGVLLAALEMLVFSFFLMWPAIAAIIMAFVNWIIPGLQWEVQVSIFAITSIVLTFVGRKFFQKSEEPETGLNQRSKQIVGKKAKVLDFNQGNGHVEIKGIRWAANWPEGQISAEGEMVKITAAHGMSVDVTVL